MRLFAESHVSRSSIAPVAGVKSMELSDRNRYTQVGRHCVREW